MTPEQIISKIARVSTKGLTIQQTALTLGRPTQFVYRNVKAGKLKAYKIGKQHMILPEDLAAFVQVKTG
jgi:excisionase family DNA binding protein